jgi:putative glutamine amidotransferase
MTRPKPIIGVPCRYDTSGTYPSRQINAQNTTYINALVQAGGVPILIPLNLSEENLEIIFNQVDGLLFTGGGDIDPTCYDEQPQVDDFGDVQPGRDEVELALMRMAISAPKPFLGICRGLQLMNVASGGTLWQDILQQRPNSLRHDYFGSAHMNYPRNHLAHDVILDDSSLLADILGVKRITVNSLHHQGAKDVAPNLRPAGHAEDNVVEVLELPEHPFGLAVQWHPEELVAEHDSARKIFVAFVDAVFQGSHK